jgi:hypothetical protein
VVLPECLGPTHRMIDGGVNGVSSLSDSWSLVEETGDNAEQP